MSDRAHRAARTVAVALLVAFAACVPFRAALIVDNRTYLEMAAGVRAHGLPYTENTWSDVLPEAAPSFNVPKAGKLWGEYPPLYAYVAAPALAIGGLRAVHQQNALLVALLAWLVGQIALLVTGRQRAATFSLLATAFATPMYAGSFFTFAMPITSLMLAASLLSAIASLRSARPLLAVAISGVFAGLAIEGHLSATLMGGALLLATAHAHAASGPREARLKAFAKALTAGGAGMAIALAPLAALNFVRFGSPNPISYGPCVWVMCGPTVGHSLDSGSLLRFGGAPVALAAAAIGLALLLRRKGRWALAPVIAGGVIAAAIPAFREPGWAMLRTLTGYFVDSTLFDLTPLERARDGLGWFRGDKITQGLLEASPLLAAAIAAKPRPGQHTQLILWSHVTGLGLSLALLGRFSGGYALGWPFIFPRYALYAVPALVVLASQAVATLRATWRDAAVGGLVLMLATWMLAQDHGDGDWAKRLLLLRVTLLSALAVVATLLLGRGRAGASRAAGLSVASAAGLSVALSIVNASGTATRVVAALDARLAKFESLVPERRFALAGWGPDSDPILSLRAERDVHYVDFVESGSWTGFRKLIDKWSDDGRPIYGVFPRDVGERAFKWPYADADVPATCIDRDEGFWKIGPPRKRARP